MTKIKVSDKKQGRIKYLMDEAIPDLGTSWQVDDETAYPGERVEAFIKSKLQEAETASGQRIGKFRWVSSGEFFTLQGFASAATMAQYDEDPDENQALLLCSEQLPLSNSQDAVSYSLKLVSGSSATQTFLGKEDASVQLRFTSQAYNPVDSTTEDTGEQGTLTIQTRADSTAAWTTKKRVTLDSMAATSAGYTTVGIGDALSVGTQQVRMRVVGNSTEQATTWLSMTITLTNLSVQFGLDWSRTFDTVKYPTINLPVYVTGQVSKVLHISVSDGTAYEFSLGTTTYTESAYTAVINSPGKHGVYTVSAWLTSGEATTDAVQLQIMVTESGSTTPLLALNNISQNLTNYDTATPFGYALWTPSGEGSVAFKLSDATSGTEYYSETVSGIKNGEQHTLSFPLKIDSEATELTGHFTFSDADGAELRSYLLVKISNTENFAATKTGLVFSLDPKGRNNSEAEPRKMVNTATGAEVAATWSGAWGLVSDLWQQDEGGQRVLRVLSGETLTLAYEPFSDDTPTDGLTIEMDVCFRNVSDREATMLNMSTTLSADSKPLGLWLTPERGALLTLGKRTTLDQDVRWARGRREHVVVNIVNNLDGGGVNYVRMYVNGTIQREFTYASDDTFWQTVGGEKTCGGIVIGGDGADVDIYGIRIYSTGLAESAIRQDYMATMGTLAEKQAYKAANDIMGDSGLIDYDKTYAKYNTLLVKGGVPSYADKQDRTVDVVVHFIGDPAHSGTLSQWKESGQGSTSKKYWKWNWQWKGSSFTDENGTEYTDGYSVAEGTPRAKKLVNKLNWASPMQSHKLGATRAWTDLWKELCGGNEITQTEGYEDVRVSVYERPVMLFVQETDAGEPVFYGLGTFGSAKGDKPTFAGSTAKFPEYLMIEGSDNNPALTLVHVPWFEDEVKEVLDDGEVDGWSYNGVVSWDFDLGNPDSLSVFIAAHNFVYLHSNRISPYQGTVEQLRAAWTSDNTALDTTRAYWVTEGSTSAAQFDLFRYDWLTKAWVAAGTTKTSGVPATVNILEQIKTAPAYTNGVGGQSYSDLLANEDWERMNQLFQNGRVELFAEGFAGYYDKTCALTHQNFIKLIAGSDNRAKNTYQYITSKSAKIMWADDDLDSIGPTENQGHQDKPYYVEEHDYDVERGKMYFNGENNTLYNLIEAAFGADLKANMKSMLSAMATLGGGSPEAFIDKYFTATTDYFPSVAYNQTSKLLYEEAERHYGTDYTNDTDPITQAVGSQREAEWQWWRDRVAYISSYASYGAFSGDATGEIVFRSTRSGTVHFDVVPAVWMYPAFRVGETVFAQERSKPGATVSADLSTDSNTQVAVKGADYLKAIGEWAGKPANGGITFIGQYIRELHLGAEDASTVELLVTSVAVGSMQNLRVLDLQNLATLTGTLDLSTLPKLTELDARGTTLTSINLPESQYLTTLHLPTTLTRLTLKNQPSLATLDMEGTDNLSELYIDQGGTAGVDTYSIAAMLAASGHAMGAGGVTLLGIGWSGCSAATLMWLANQGATLTGHIKMQAGSADRYLTLAEVVKLMSLYGDINSETNQLYIEYDKKDILGFSISGERYMSEPGDYQMEAVPFPTTGNNVAIKDGKPWVEWSIDATAAPYASFTDAANGVLTVTALSDATKQLTHTVTATLHLTDGSTLEATTVVGFYKRSPEVGDFAYGDGTFNSEYEQTKDLVGIVYKRDAITDSSGTITGYTVRVVALDDVALVSSDKTVNGSAQPWGLLQDNGTNGFNTTVEGAIKEATGLTAVYDVPSVANIGTSGGNVNDSNYIDDTTADGYKEQSASTLQEDWDGETKTAALVAHCSLILEKYLGIKTPTSLSDLADKMAALMADNSSEARWKQYFYAPAMSCHLYEPAAEDTLDDQYKQGQWYLMSGGEACRIANFGRLGTEASKASSTAANEARTPIFANANARAATTVFKQLNGAYWTASESSGSNSWHVYLGNGSVYYGNKYGSYCVRPCTAFTFNL